MLRVQWYSRFVPVLAALAAGVLALSCGGGAERESVTAPPTLAAPDAGGSVTASATVKQEVCHYDAVLDTYTTLNLTSQALAAHLKSHTKDYAGACRTATCPCFTAEQLALTCDGVIMGCEPPAYTFYKTCPGASILGIWDVIPEAGSCSAYTPFAYDYPDVALSGISADEAAACVQLIVNSPNYPASCPQ